MTQAEQECIDIIRDHLTKADLFGQLAEEAAELAQAALKLQRILLNRNLPRISQAEASANLVEEHADLALCFELLGWSDKVDRKRIRSEKLFRWAKHLMEG